MQGNVDIFTSRRNCNNLCYYWIRRDNEDDSSIIVSVDKDLNEMVYEREPDGSFYANEMQTYDSENQIIGGTFMFDQNFVTIVTEDNIPNININDIVVYDDEVWRISSISKRKRKRQNQFSRNCAYKTYLYLKR